jgi:hypothetical protein
MCDDHGSRAHQHHDPLPLARRQRHLAVLESTTSVMLPRCAVEGEHRPVEPGPASLSETAPYQVDAVIVSSARVERCGRAANPAALSCRRRRAVSGKIWHAVLKEAR